MGSFPSKVIPGAGIFWPYMYVEVSETAPITVASAGDTATIFDVSGVHGVFYSFHWERTGSPFVKARLYLDNILVHESSFAASETYTGPSDRTTGLYFSSSLKVTIEGNGDNAGVGARTLQYAVRKLLV